MKRTALRPSRKPIPRRSAKTTEAYIHRRALVSRMIYEAAKCFVEGHPDVPPCRGPLTVNEILSRGRGGSILDESNCQVLCAGHNQWAAENHNAAESLGLSRRRWPKEQA